MMEMLIKRGRASNLEKQEIHYASVGLGLPQACWVAVYLDCQASLGRHDVACRLYL